MAGASGGGPGARSASTDGTNAKRGSAIAAPSLNRIRSAASSGDLRPSWRALNLAGCEATCANLDLGNFSFNQNARYLQIRLEYTTGTIVGVRDIIPEGYALSAHVTVTVSHDYQL